jgi:anthranilate synthase/phosphoribosyltransferase
MIGELFVNEKNKESQNQIIVKRNDEITIDEIKNLNPAAIIISPGPGYPKDAGISIEVIKTFCKEIPILGVCLGEQAICEAFGGVIIPAKHLMHGKASEIYLDTKSDLFFNLTDKIKAARYHSLIAEMPSLPECLTVIARDENNQIMAVQHKEYPVYGLQFHPESVMTEAGSLILGNFLNKIVGININTNHIQIPVKAEQKVLLKPIIAKAVEGENLTEKEAYKAVTDIMSGLATDAQVGALLTALRMKGETVEEITGFAKGMRDKAASLSGCENTVDIVGTGGDLAMSFNISTTSSLVACGAGAKVAKHGNRSVSSKSGSADVLEALGVKINSNPEVAENLIKTIGISFLFAQSFHGAMRFVGPARSQTGIRTIFNILGPLANPAKANYIVLGTYDKALLKPMADVLINVGIKQAMLVYGNDKLDEVSISDKTSVCEVKDGKIKSYEISPEDFGFKLADKSVIVGGDAAHNAEITLGILKGEITDSKRDIVLLNSGCAIYTYGMANSIAEGIEIAKESIDSGAAFSKLKELIKYSHQN